MAIDVKYAFPRIYSI